MDRIVVQLEDGVLVKKFYLRKRPEQRRLLVRLDNRQLIWQQVEHKGSNTYEGCVDLREIREVRIGTDSKDFDRWASDTKKLQSNLCFVVLYGSEFVLETLSIAASTWQDCELWVRGLKYLVDDTLRSPYPSQVRWWLKKEFIKIQTPQNKVTLKSLKAFFLRNNWKRQVGKLGEAFEKMDSEHNEEINFEEFAHLYYMMYDDKPLVDRYFSEYSSDGTVSVQGFRAFLLNQSDVSDDNSDVSSFLVKFRSMKDSTTEDEPSLTTSEFVGYLFSKQNEIWDPSHSEITQDMTRPLSHYWIDSSHNTYLTGDQIFGVSSTEAYVRCLRYGCRCIELDCWDGSDGQPIIYHGHTPTTRIKFLDVIKAIKQHAFVASDYPVVLSIEDHCSLSQQRKMARDFQGVFGELLLTRPIARDETELPPPNALKRKIIVKHKKLPASVDDAVAPDSSGNDDENDLMYNAVKSGQVYLEVSGMNQPHFMVLTKDKLYCTELNSYEEMSDFGSHEGVPQEEVMMRDRLSDYELHFSETWFHGLMDARKTSRELLQQHSHLGDGTFLVRDSQSYVGDYTLCFWLQGKEHQCRIQKKKAGVQTKYFIYESEHFSSLYNLVRHYKSNPLVLPKFSVVLTEAVPQPEKHHGKPWFYQGISRAQAENILKDVLLEGAFLVRQKEHRGLYAISLRAEGQIKHCRVERDGRLYRLGATYFETLSEMVSYYQAHPLYHRIRLTYPVDVDASRYQPVDEEPGTASAGDSGYVDVVPRFTVKAVKDYQAAQRNELSFKTGAIITNVIKVSGVWWKGDYGGKKGHWFLRKYTKEIDQPTSGAEEHQQTTDEPESWAKGTMDVTGVTADVSERPGMPFPWNLRIQPQSGRNVLNVEFFSKEEATKWKDKIVEIARKAADKEIRRIKIEREKKVAKELSNLIVYCQAVTFNLERLKGPKRFREMSSVTEIRAENLLVRREHMFFLHHHQIQLTRVYPKGQRFDSSNYDPTPCWNVGCHMVALNYQTPDYSMQINHGMFLGNGGCGYLLRPDCMFEPGYDPFDPETLGVSHTRVLRVRVIGARHLSRVSSGGRRLGVLSPYVVVEVIGAPYDSGAKNRYSTLALIDSGFSPLWDEWTDLSVRNPECALLRFVVYDKDAFNEPHLVGQATYPIACLRQGYRSVPLKNGYSEELELASLLVHLQVLIGKEEEEEEVQSPRMLQDGRLTTFFGDDIDESTMDMQQEMEQLWTRMYDSYVRNEEETCL